MGRRGQDIPDETTGDIDMIGFVDPNIPEEVSDDVVATSNYHCSACGEHFTESEMGHDKDKCPTCGEQDCIDQP